MRMKFQKTKLQCGRAPRFRALRFTTPQISFKELWSQQLTASDLWNSGCVAEQKDNCPDPRGDDFDFGAPPVLNVTQPTWCTALCLRVEGRPKIQSRSVPAQTEPSP
jgi:hypothetical protein